jgi:hypothetical protein
MGMNQSSPAPREGTPRDQGPRGDRAHGAPDDDGRGGARRRIGALFGLALIVLLAVAAAYLVQALRRESQLEDCLLSGRTNCAPIAVPAR